MTGVWPPDVIPDDLDDVIRLYMLHERFGGLPEPGGLLDQDARVMSVWSELSCAMGEIRDAVDQDAAWRARKG